MLTQELIEACKRGQSNVVIDLLRSGCHPGAVDEDGNCAIHVAYRHDRQDIVHLLLRAGANPNALDRQGNALAHYAAELDDVQLLNMLRSVGANLQIRNGYVKTPLDCARERYATGSMKLLGKNQHSSQVDALCEASMEGDVHSIDRLLFEKDVDPNTPGGDKKQVPLAYAIRSSQSEAVQALLDGSADVNHTEVMKAFVELAHDSDLSSADIEIVFALAGAGMQINDQALWALLHNDEFRDEFRLLKDERRTTILDDNIVLLLQKTVQESDTDFLGTLLQICWEDLLNKDIGDVLRLANELGNENVITTLCNFAELQPSGVTNMTADEVNA